MCTWRAWLWNQKFRGSRVLKLCAAADSVITNTYSPSVTANFELTVLVMHAHKLTTFWFENVTSLYVMLKVLEVKNVSCSINCLLKILS